MMSRFAVVVAVLLGLGVAAPGDVNAAPEGQAKDGKAAAAAKVTKAVPKKGTDVAKKAQGEDSARPKATPEKRAQVARLKAQYIFAAESCTPNAKCDPALVEDAERNFMFACEECAPSERCDADRELIKKGQGKRRVNPCDGK